MRWHIPPSCSCHTAHLAGEHCLPSAVAVHTPQQTSRSHSTHHSPCLSLPAAFFTLYHAVSQQQPQQGNPESQLHHFQRRLHQHSTSGIKPNTTAPSTTPSQGKQGDPSLTPPQRAVRIGFYLWLSLLNLVATSTLWARAADAFDSHAAKRLFGFLGAGATLGPSRPHPPDFPP